MILALLMLAPTATPAWMQDPAADAARLQREEPWDFSFGIYNFNPPDDHSYQSFIFGADKGAWHFEARYSYEALYASSFFIGRNFKWPGDFTVRATPMIGVVAGDTNGVAPALNFDVSWHDFFLSSESEYLFDTVGDDDSFFYTWNELLWRSSSGLNLGLAAQRTQTYDQDLDIDRGLVFGLQRGSISLNAYWFNPDRDDEYWVVRLGGSQ